ncbi:vacuolar-sorting receptor 1-like isoform X3 [Magnolia sinica]|uniref:vacuolar-sorting receptor 1-like isoform X3 n=1 Tax=Magnolia sinica TaxID=86752 RepID=UPI00265A62FE|nr:vacuolar-sorting receptor 1-like isoform X3 [Magnolia sinica]
MVSVHESQTNGCLNYNGGCWEDKAANIIGCKDTFCGRVCECPLVQEVEFKGDVYSSCQVARRCKIVNFLGLEINKKLVKQCLDFVQQHGLKNLHS